MPDDFHTTGTLSQSDPNDLTELEPLIRRIGKTIYQVKIHFSRKSKETMDEKIIRLIEHENIQTLLIPETDPAPQTKIKKLPHCLVDGKNDLHAKD